MNSDTVLQATSDWPPYQYIQIVPFRTHIITLQTLKFSPISISLISLKSSHFCPPKTDSHFDPPQNWWPVWVDVSTARETRLDLSNDLGTLKGRFLGSPGCTWRGGSGNREESRKKTSKRLNRKDPTQSNTWVGVKVWDVSFGRLDPCNKAIAWACDANIYTEDIWRYLMYNEHLLCFGILMCVDNRLENQGIIPGFHWD